MRNLLTAVVAATALLTSAATAFADWRGDRSSRTEVRFVYRGGPAYAGYWTPPRYYRPVYIAPVVYRPVYYPAAATYVPVTAYYPPPVIYAPPVVVRPVPVYVQPVCPPPAVSVEWRFTYAR